jgi:hypothetical protein
MSPQYNVKTVCSIFLLALQLILAGCAKEPPGFKGNFDEWVAGRDVSLKVSAKVVDGRELPSVDFQNRRKEGFPVAPLRCVATYKNGGEIEITWKSEDRSIEVKSGGALSDFFTIALKSAKGDRLERVVLEYGPAADDRFIFDRK